MHTTNTVSDVDTLTVESHLTTTEDTVLGKAYKTITIVATDKSGNQHRITFFGDASLELARSDYMPIKDRQS